MLAIIFSFIISVVMILIILYTGNVHAKLSLDHDLQGIQKQHDTPTPRIGGLAIFISMVFTALYGANIQSVWAPYFCGLITSMFFVFIGGLTEDLSKAVSPLVRIGFILLAIFFGVYVSHSIPVIHNLDEPSINHFLTSFGFVAFAITAFAIAGISNAFNIIDGYNGLSSTTALVNVLGLCFLSFELHDHIMIVVSLIFAFSILGFLLFNYPKGKIFLGDGGAYLLGFSIAVISLNLTEHHLHQISPFAVLLLAVYPFTETVFTIVRRKFIHKTKVSHPDALHLHQLVFDRCVPRHLPQKKRNYMVMPVMSMFMVPQAVFVVCFYKSTLFMLLGMLAYVIYYLYFYIRLVKFKTPKFMMIRS